MKSAKYDLRDKQKRIVLINRTSLYTLAIVTLTLLWVLQPNRDLLVRMMDSAQDPNIAIAFLKVLQDKDQPSLQVDYSLAFQYSRLGQYNKTRALLTPITRFYESELRISATSLYTQTLLNLTLVGNDSARQELEQYLLTKILEVEERQIDSFSDYALQIGRPNIAYYIRSQAGTPDEAQLLDLALQANLPGRAVEHAYRLYLDNPSQPNFAQVLALFEALKRFDNGFALYRRHQQLGLCEAQCKQTMVDFSLRANQPKQAARFAILKANSSSQSSDWLQASQLSLAASDQLAARYWLEKVAEVEAKETYLEKLHDYALWEGKPQRALQYSKKLLAIESSQSRLQQALLEAGAVGDIQAASDFGYELARKGLLADGERLVWVNNNDKAFGARLTLVRLQNLQQQFPKSQFYWGQTARFYGFTGQLQAVVDLWERRPSGQALDFETANYFAKSFVALGKLEQALAIYAEAQTLGQLDGSQLAQILSLANYTGAEDIERAVQQALLVADAKRIDPYRLSELLDLSSSEDRQTLWQAYRETGSLVVLNSLLSYGLQTQDSQIIERVAAALESHQDDTQMAMSMRLQLQLYRGSLAQARASVESMLEQYPNNADALLNGLWLAVQLRDWQWLQQLYWRAAIGHQGDMAFYPVLGFGASKLGLLSQANYWYQALNQADQLRITDRLSWALVAEQQGNQALAQQQRWLVFSQFGQALKQSPQGELSYRSLVATFVGQQRAELDNELAIFERATNENVAYGLSIRSSFALQKYQYWQALDLLADVRFSDSIMLALAIAREDQPTMLALARDSNQLSEFERATAFDLLSENFAAWQAGEKALNSSLPANQQAPLQRFLADIHTEHSHGVRVEHTVQQTWNVAYDQLTYYRPLFDGWLNLDGYQEYGQPTTDLLDTYQAQRLRAGWVGRPWGELNAVELALNARQRFGKTTFGQMLYGSFNTGERVQQELRLSRHMPTTQSENMALLGREDRIEWSGSWRATRYEQLSLGLSLARFHTDFNDRIGDQFRAQLRVAEQLSREPGWQVYGQFDYQDNRISQQPLNGLSNYLNSDASLSGNQFLQPQYRKFTLGQHLVHGEVGVPGPDRRPPRYWLDTSVEYNFVTRRVGYGFSLAGGLPLMGSDELFFKLRWQSADQNNRKSLVWNLGYFVDF
ncbi:tetratricopeptide repeat protein [Paraferrimonas sedimenticola]|uniref:PelB C-terminal domain-containing protein n=1 Tax=Paraferrimonas sedimenticola TaxID=375674 RepID=A0AA37RW97_9GAMM|nr:hypothetical protein [Paraferrimonas sedimenticola]GLP96346.1 hypothetical protein GCM10007895_16520 [Paraferrimonas sedimenticola]